MKKSGGNTKKRPVKRVSKNTKAPKIQHLGLPEISSEKFACARGNGMTVIFHFGQFDVPLNWTLPDYAQVDPGPIHWICGDTDETWDPPDGTAYIKVTRENNGHGFVSYFAGK